MYRLFRILITLAAVVYVVSPLDVMPGVPFDDILVVLLGLVGDGKLLLAEKKNN